MVLRKNGPPPGRLRSIRDGRNSSTGPPPSGESRHLAGTSPDDSRTRVLRSVSLALDRFLKLLYPTHQKIWSTAALGCVLLVWHRHSCRCLLPSSPCAIHRGRPVEERPFRAAKRSL